VLKIHVQRSARNNYKGKHKPILWSKFSVLLPKGVSPLLVKNLSFCDIHDSAGMPPSDFLPNQ